jgi:hypothetical protein
MKFFKELPKQVQIILLTNIVIIIGFALLVIERVNTEFMLYMAVILFFLALITFTYKRITYPPYLLWCLTIWSTLHMAGGLLIARGDVWYNLMLIDIFPSVEVLKYDQAVHLFGFFTATLLLYVILKPHLKTDHIGVAVGIVIVAAGSGAGAWNEIVEFIAQASFEDANVGGYLNTSLDTIFNLVGGIAALVFLKIRESLSQKN